MFGQPSFNPTSPFYIGHYAGDFGGGGPVEPLFFLIILIPMALLTIFAAFSGILRRQMIVCAVIFVWIIAAIIFHSNK